MYRISIRTYVHSTTLPSAGDVSVHLHQSVTDFHSCSSLSFARVPFIMPNASTWCSVITSVAIVTDCSSFSFHSDKRLRRPLGPSPASEMAVKYSVNGSGSLCHGMQDHMHCRPGKASLLSHRRKGSALFINNQNRDDTGVNQNPAWHSAFSMSIASFVVIGLSFFGTPDSSSAFDSTTFNEMFFSSQNYPTKGTIAIMVTTTTPITSAPSNSELFQYPTKLKSGQSSEPSQAKINYYQKNDVSKNVNLKQTGKNLVPVVKMQQNKLVGSKQNIAKTPEIPLDSEKTRDSLAVMNQPKETTKMPNSNEKLLQPKKNIAGAEKLNDPSKKSAKGELQAIDVKKVAEENTIDIELVCKDDDRPLRIPSQSAIIKIDRNTFQKIKVSQPSFLQWLPPSLQPRFQSMQVLKSIPNDQLFFASVVAGSLTEIIRTLLLYPLGTVKARVQARTLRSTNRNRPLLRKLRVTWLTFLYETKRGGWYDGILPTLLISIPASGVYSGVKDVSRRIFSMVVPVQFFSFLFHGDIATSSYFSVLGINLLAAFVADVASLAIRVPADVLSLRLQVFGNTNVKSDLSDWAKDSILLLPAMVTTDLPFLLSRIFLNAAVTTSGENLGRYEIETIAVACLCAFLTTPFDVARTRILLPTLPSEEVEDNIGMIGQSESQRRRRLVASSKYREQRRQKLSVLITMKSIAAEGNGGLQNLFAGWIERTAFLGVGRAWLDPLRVIGYLGIRDALLLKLFD